MKAAARKLLQSPTFRKFSASAGYLIAERVVRLVSVVLIASRLALSLGPQQFGLYSATIATMALFGLMADLGLPRIVIRDLVRQAFPARSLMGTAMTIRVIGGLSMALIGLLITTLVGSDETGTVLALASLLAIGWALRSLDTIDLGFQAESRVHLAVIPRTIALILATVLQLILIEQKAPLWMYGLAFALESLLAGVGMILTWHLWANLPMRTWRFDRSTAGKLVGESWPLFIALVASNIYHRIDQFMVAALHSDYEAGIYAAAARIYEILLGMVPILNVALFPILTRWHQKSLPEFQRRYVHLTWALTLGAGVLVLGAGLFRHTIVHTLFGPRFQASADVMYVHMLCLLVIYNAMLRVQFLTLAGLQRLLMWTNILAAVVNISLNIYIIPRYGAIGASLVLLFTQVIALQLSNLLVPETRWLFAAQLGLMRPVAIPANHPNISEPEVLSEAMHDADNP